MTSTAIPLEKTIVNGIIKGLKAQGVGFIVKTHGSLFQAAGLPDIILIAPRVGRFVGLEVKRPVLGVTSELQKAVIRKINRAGGYACVVYSPEAAQAALQLADAGEQAPMIA